MANTVSTEILIISDLILYLGKTDPQTFEEQSAKEVVYNWFNEQESIALKETTDGTDALKDLKEVGE